MRFLAILSLYAAALSLLAQTPPKPPPHPPVEAPPIAPSAPATPTPTITGPDGVTLPLVITPPPVIPPERVVIQVGDLKLTAAQMDQILQAYPENQRAFVNGPGRSQFIDQVVRVIDERALIFRISLRSSMARGAPSSSTRWSASCSSPRKAGAAISPKPKLTKTSSCTRPPASSPVIPTPTSSSSPAWTRPRSRLSIRRTNPSGSRFPPATSSSACRALPPTWPPARMTSPTPRPWPT